MSDVLFHEQDYSTLLVNLLYYVKSGESARASRSAYWRSGVGNSESFVVTYHNVIVVYFVRAFAIERFEKRIHFRTIEASEIAAGTSGVDVPKYRLITFVISSAFPGIIGGIYGLYILYVHPYDAFASLKTDQTVVMTLLGGAGSYIGPVIGAVILMVALEVLWTYFTEILYLIFLGILIGVVVVFMPQWILGLVQKGAKKEEIFARFKLMLRFKSR